jgi:DNA invertase Pin-like site-specific DNA recombinase
MIFGYARVSTYEQNMDLQTDALNQANCDKIFTDKVSGIKSERVELSKLKEQLRAGDTIVVWKFDRMSRSLRDLIDLIKDLELKKVGFVSLTEKIDTSTPSGKLAFHIFASMAEFERDMIRERTLAGLASARARGKNGGRPKKLSHDQQKLVLSMYQNKTVPIKTILDTFKISKTLMYEVVAELKVKTN